MKLFKFSLLIAGFGLVSLASSGAMADHWHGGGRGGVRFGVVVGGPGYYYPPPYYYGAPYDYPPYYYPPVVVQQQQPTVYVEQPQAQAPEQQAAGNYWYYCAGSKTYYPYVKDCPAGWQRVTPQPPSP